MMGTCRARSVNADFAAIVESAGTLNKMPAMPTSMRRIAHTLLSRKRRAAPSFLDPRGGRAGRSPALGALSIVAVLLLVAGTAQTADARPYGYYPGHGGAWVGWGGGYYGPGWGYRAPYYGYGYGYGFGLATGAALGWSMGGPWWPANYWGGVGYAYPPAYYPYAGVAVAVPAAPVEQVYIQQPQEVVVPPAAQPRRGLWYYCSAPAGYYPDVNSCSRPWIAVDPQSGGRTGSADGVTQGR
jgi:hypothetical protein